MATKHLIIGTAGHVDHGKTALIRALTGAETDRFPEEKARGISIDIGFAEFVLPSGRRAAVIDVPGHEKFIRNMLAGITGIDLVLLVVAADEGVMPQTREHLDILRLLEIQQGLVVLTKKDLVDEELLELAKDDVQDAVRGTFLEKAPVIAVSAVTGEGIPELVKTLDALLADAPSKDPTAFTRLPIDRAFVRTGFGTVVTGTLVAGSISAGDRLEILPLGLETRARGLQVHGHNVPRAEAGQRVAVNLAGIERSDIGRGLVLCAPGVLRATDSFAGRLRLLPSWPKPIPHGVRVHLHTGTSEVLARVLLLDRDELKPGEAAYAQFKCEAPLVVGRGDHYVMRSYSPVHTMGGGVVIEPHANYRRNRSEVIEELKVKESGGLAGVILETLAKAAALPTPAGELAKRTGILPETLAAELVELRQQGDAVSLEGDLWLHRRGYAAFVQQVREYLEKFYQQYPLRLGAAKEELRRKLLPGVDPKGWNALLTATGGRGDLAVERDRVALPGHRPQLTLQQSRLAAQLTAEAIAGGYSPPTLAELKEKLRGADLDEIALYLTEQGTLVRLGDDLIIHTAHLEEAKKRTRAHLQAKGKLSVAEFRDLLGTTRKYALPLLEYFDENRYTRRAGEERTIGPAWVGQN